MIMCKRMRSPSCDMHCTLTLSPLCLNADLKTNAPPESSYISAACFRKCISYSGPRSPLVAASAAIYDFSVHDRHLDQIIRQLYIISKRIVIQYDKVCIFARFHTALFTLRAIQTCCVQCHFPVGFEACQLLVRAEHIATACLPLHCKPDGCQRKQLLPPERFGEQNHQQQTE